MSLYNHATCVMKSLDNEAHAKNKAILRSMVVKSHIILRAESPEAQYDSALTRNMCNQSIRHATSC